MRKDWRLKHGRIPFNQIPFNQLDTWRHLKVEIDQLEARWRQLPEAMPPSPLLVEMVRLLRADLFHLVSREVGARALKRPVPDTADKVLLAQNLDEARLALTRFREAHSAHWSERDDQWLID